MKYAGIDKFFYKTQYGRNCSHLKYAIENKKIFHTNDINPKNPTEYSNISKAFKDFEEYDEVQYLKLLKTKVLNYYKKEHESELEKYNEEFEVSFEGLYAKIDFLKLDKQKKEIDFILIKPSIYKEDLIKKTASKSLAAELKTYNETGSFNWRKKSLAGYNPNSLKEYKPFNETDNPTEQDIFKHFLMPSLFQANKKILAAELCYLMTLLNKVYPNYKINFKLPLIVKSIRPFKFKDWTFSFDPDSKEGKLNIKFWDDILNITQDSTKAKPFELPEWVLFFNYLKSCEICSEEKQKEKISQHFDEEAVKEQLNKFPDKIAMFDFETINDPLPDSDFYLPYDKIVVQVSIHLMENGEITDHKEYLVKNLSLEELDKIYQMVVDVAKDGYRLTAYSKDFERGALKAMERVLEKRDFSSMYNFEGKIRNGKENPAFDSNKLELLDIMDFFNKRSNNSIIGCISLNRFGPSYSIKKTIELYAGNNNPYKKLPINNGFKAMKELYDIIIGGKKEGREQELLEYCKQDTLTMVDIYKKIIKVYDKIIKDPTKKEEILKKLDI